MSQVLYDAVTLEHFAAAGQLTLLPRLHHEYDEPRWVEQVFLEIQAGANMLKSRAICQTILALDWLGDPVAGPLGATMQIRAVIADGTAGDEHLGEAESIALAQKTGGVFVTDDAGAYDFAIHPRRLGPAGVLDSCALLWQAVSDNLIDYDQLENFHTAVFDAGRTMRCRCSHWPGGDSLDERLRTALRPRL